MSYKKLKGEADTLEEVSGSTFNFC